MSQPNPSPRPAPPRDIRFGEFVAIVAALMAMNSLSIDPMLPALPAIGDALHVAHANDRQWVVTCYLLGLGGGSLVFGPLSDRFGRRRLTLLSVALFLCATIACALAPSFTFLLAARGVAGFLAASSRVISVSIVRDRYAGDRMARVMSLAYVVFMVVPVVAPAFGQAILVVTSWRGIFAVLALLDVGLLGWLFLRLPETLPPERRTPIDPRAMSRLLARVVTHRNSLGHMIGSGIVMAGTVAFITSVQQIFAEIFRISTLFPLAFAGMSALMAAGGFANSRLVERVGARRLSQGALVALIALSATHAGIAWTGRETLTSFMVLQALSMLCISLTGSNLGAIAMEPYTTGAGLASSFQAFQAAIVSAALGASIGRAYDGTTLPLALGFLAFGLSAFGIVAWAERGRLFARPRRARPTAEEAGIEFG